MSRSKKNRLAVSPELAPETLTAPETVETSLETPVTPDLDLTPADAPESLADATPETDLIPDATPEADATPAPEAPEPTEAEAAAYARRVEGARKRMSGEYDPTKTHANLLTRRVVAVAFGDVELESNEEGEPDFEADRANAVYEGGMVKHRRVPSSEKWQLEAPVYFDGVEALEYAYTTGTWRGVTTTSLWVRVPTLSVPAYLTAGLKVDGEATAVFHVLVPNGSTCAGARIYTLDAPAEPTPAEAATPADTPAEPAKAKRVRKPKVTEAA